MSEIVKVTVNANLNNQQLQSLFSEVRRDYPEHYAVVTEHNCRKTVITCTPREQVLSKLSKLCPQTEG